MDYLNSVSGLARLNEPQGSRERDLLAKVADAKGRICLYGSKEVIHAFALFEKLGAVVSSVQQRAAFVAMVIAMRNDSGNSADARTEDIALVLLGSRDELDGPLGNGRFFTGLDARFGVTSLWDGSSAA